MTFVVGSHSLCTLLRKVIADPICFAFVACWLKPAGLLSWPLRGPTLCGRKNSCSDVLFLFFVLLTLLLCLLNAMEPKCIAMLCLMCFGFLSTGYFILKRDGISPCIPAWAESIPASGFLAQYAPTAPNSLAQEMDSPVYFRVICIVLQRPILIGHIHT